MFVRPRMLGFASAIAIPAFFVSALAALAEPTAVVASGWSGTATFHQETTSVEQGVRETRQSAAQSVGGPEPFAEGTGWGDGSFTMSEHNTLDVPNYCDEGKVALHREWSMETSAIGESVIGITIFAGDPETLGLSSSTGSSYPPVRRWSLGDCDSPAYDETSPGSEGIGEVGEGSLRPAIPLPADWRDKGLHGNVHYDEIISTVQGPYRVITDAVWDLTLQADRDHDGFADPSDTCPDEFATPDSTNGCPTKPQCNDGFDNDLDGNADFPSDPDCLAASGEIEGQPHDCSDGSDNDHDGLVDFPADPDCTSPTDNSEEQKPVCADGVDNDGDGSIDFPADAGCASAAAMTEEGAGTIIVREFTEPATADAPFAFEGAIPGVLGRGQQLTRDVPAGKYAVRQRDIVGWRLKSIGCDDGTPPNMELKLANYAVRAGQTSICTFVNVADPWDPLVLTAANELQGANGTKLSGTAGFFEQVLNIVCAAARSPRVVCSQMAATYAGTQWASDGIGCEAEPGRAFCWVFNVFNGYLTKSGAFELGAKLRKTAQRGAEKMCSITPKLRRLSKSFACKWFARTDDGQTLYAGVLHFNNSLEPYFHRVTKAVLSGDVGEHLTKSEISAALQTIRIQHNALVDHAVLPGFDNVYEQGGVSSTALTVAQWVVPFAAVCFREDAIYDTLRDSRVLGFKLGSEYYAKATPPSARATYFSPWCSALRGLAEVEDRNLK